MVLTAKVIYSVAVDRCSGGQLAMTLVATISTIISFFPPFSSPFLIEGVRSIQETYFAKVDMNGQQKPTLSQTPLTNLGPLPAILYFAGIAELHPLQAVSEYPPHPLACILM